MPAIAVALGCLFASAPASAWIYPEHRTIGVRAWSELSPEVQAFYAALWQRARFGYSAGLCAVPVPGEKPSSGESERRSPCIDWAAWPAIAGDHSCSPDELIEEVLPSFWVHGVARVSQEVNEGLADADSPDDRENLWITSHLRLEAVDDAYLTRAGANNAHFLLSLTGESMRGFVAQSTQEGAPLNALGLYVQYHAAALRLAARLGADPGRASSAFARKLLALEAYALHFLQDMYASGHVAGSWGDVATRKGTHDYYCAHGYATTSWSGRNLIMYGDAHAKPADLERAAAAMAASMAQVFAAARDAARSGRQDGGQAHEALEAAALDSCKLRAHPEPIPLTDSETAAVERLLAETPRPGYGPESVAWPRYRADFGPFIGLGAGIGVGGAFGGFGGSPGRFASELSVGARVGFGLEGVVARVNSGTMYLQLGLVSQSAQADYCVDDCDDLVLGTADLPRVPSRTGFALELRMPFWLIPGDLVLLAPILAIVSPPDLRRVAIRAASGGLIPWQRTIATSIGYFEAVLGRDIGAVLYGWPDRVQALEPVFPGAPADDSSVIVNGFRSLTLTFPVIEYTPFRVFAEELAGALQLQLAYAIDLPFDTIRYDETVVPGPDWEPAHLVLLKLTLDGRFYF